MHMNNISKYYLMNYNALSAVNQTAAAFDSTLDI